MDNDRNPDNNSNNRNTKNNKTEYYEITDYIDTKSNVDDYTNDNKVDLNLNRDKDQIRFYSFLSFCVAGVYQYKQNMNSMSISKNSKIAASLTTGLVSGCLTYIILKNLYNVV